jgi:O-acetyl-ADP-ribose deacetylase (regulator of RNase III)
VKFLEGDATDPIGGGVRIIAHICNDQGLWGRGFVLAVSRRWLIPEREYRAWARDASRPYGFGLGRIQVVAVAHDLWVANMIGQHGIEQVEGQPPIRYDAVEQCLRAVAVHAVNLGASVHMPRIGCGLAGGQWSRIGPIIERTLEAREIAVTVYDLPQPGRYHGDSYRP